MSTIALDERLRELSAELTRGERQLMALDQQRQQLRDTLLRISGAIQVLRELASDADGESARAAAG
ncbi:MAG: hypothetical protein E6J41_08105 [Chloroflexi bacterium]|nr:MAG: hypothetical protein E6J41_08105 [Chloroflexota bacterium]